MVAKSSLLGLLWGVVLCLFSAGAREVKVIQPQSFVSAIRGKDLMLECSVSNPEDRPGAVRWLMGEAPPRKIVYPATTSPGRVTRTNPDSSSDFSISIHNVAPEDAGTYYCVKQRPESGGEGGWQSEGGTKVAVIDDVLPAVVGTVCILLAVLISAALYVYVKKKRGKKGCSSRSKGPSSENPGTPHQTPPDREVVYVDVQHPRGAQRPKESKPEEHSTYATIR